VASLEATVTAKPAKSPVSQSVNRSINQSTGLFLWHTAHLEQWHHFCDSGTVHKCHDLLTYLFIYPVQLPSVSAVKRIIDR